jgi:hypothetical protein
MIKTIVISTALLILTGCAHNINVQGLGIATPYGAMGYGTFSCVKDNVSVKTNEKTTKDGIETVSEFTVGKQTTGYDVELEAVKQKGGNDGNG